jgi:hypothetical protein
VETLPEVITPEVLPAAVEPRPEHTLIDNIATEAVNGVKETLEEMKREGVTPYSPEWFKRLFLGSKEKMFHGIEKNPVLNEMKKKQHELGDGK